MTFPFFVTANVKLKNSHSTQILSEEIDDALAVIAKVETSRELESLRVEYLGRRGSITGKLKQIGELPPEERRAYGQAVNAAKQSVSEAIYKKAEVLESRVRVEELSEDTIDVTLPGRSVNQGSIHPVTRSVRRIKELFGRLGFDVADGPEIEDDFHNFGALNIPVDHPARAMHDTFYVSDELVLRTHTSPVQVRYMKSHEPPIRVIAPGRVYRCDSDVTHTAMFNQVEGLAVGTDVAFSDLKGILIYFVREFFEKDLPVRFRPSYFPFTEPSAEVDMGCVFCDSKGCRVCQHTGWLEILGCGMVHPEVFRHVGIDSEKYTGYAFGMGIERVTMLRYAVDDLRLFFENELAFLNQFR